MPIISAPANQQGRAWTAWAVTVVLATLHSLAIWTAMGGREGLNNGWPLWRDDHPLYFHSALVTRHFLRQNGTTAGYDPSFMSGYAKSVVWPSSSTLPEFVVALFGGEHPEYAYKIYVLVSAALIPWLVALAGVLWSVRPWGVALSVLLFLFYVWTDFPINYATFGMLPYLLAIPLGLVATGLFCRYLSQGRKAWWLASVLGMSLVVLVHLTASMIIVPAALVAYVTACLPRGGQRQAFSRWKHVGVWLIPLVVLATNANWWLPGIWLRSTKGPSDFAFVHSQEGILQRLTQIFNTESPAECILIAIGFAGLALLWKCDRVAAVGLSVFSAAGFFWGYLAAGWSTLDSLQPGRHTYAFYTGLALAAGIALAKVADRLRAGPGPRLDRWAAAGVLLIGWRFFGHDLNARFHYMIQGPIPFLSSHPSPRMLWVIDRVKRHVKPGDRLLYEEGGKDVPGVPDPFQ